MKFSDDYKRPWFGLTTTAVEFDKWAHFGGSAAGVAVLFLFQWVLLFVADAATSRSFTMAGLMEPDMMWMMIRIDWIVVNVIGLFIEFLQAAVYDPRNPESPDGFSFMDVIANVAGSSSVVGVVGLCLKGS